MIYILVLRSLSKFAHLLDEAGYQVQPAPVRVSDRSIWITWFAALLVCISAATLLFGRYPMEWSPRPEGEQAGLERSAPTWWSWVCRSRWPTTCQPRICLAWRELRVEVEITEEPFNDGQEVRTVHGNLYLCSHRICSKRDEGDQSGGGAAG